MDDSLSNFVKGNMPGNNKGTESEVVFSTQTLISDAISDDAKLNEISADSKPEVVILIGFPSYGKTSFVSTCYQLLLQDGKIGEYEFYDSDTFIGFERRVSARRLSNNNNSSQTKRTLRGESHLLTFRLKHPKFGNKILVFSDRSGENYEDYANRKDASNSDKLLRYADRLLFFISCEELVGHSFLKLKDKYSRLLNNLIGNDILSFDTTIDLLYNKSDLITQDKRDKFIKNKSTLNELFKQALARVQITEYQIVSNNISESKNIEDLLLTIISQSNEQNKSGENSTKLDWVKSLINNK